MVSRTQNSGIFGLIGAVIGGLMGYRQAVESGISPVQGALILGAFGLIVGSAGGFLLRTLGSLILYIVLMAAIIYIFREPMEAMLGIDPTSSFQTLFDDVMKVMPF
ncbi:MAG: hypothetical protein ACON4C_05700 [Henriciella sp.]|jgi:predicted neutral ceramidase superfamily lipid hydrolase